MRKLHDLRGAYMTREAGTRQVSLETMNAKGGMRMGLQGVEVRAADKEKRTVELAFSSENDTLLRWFGYEVLSHAAGAIRLDRLSDGAALLMDHDWRDQVGVVESVEIGADRKGRAVVRFGNSPRAQEIFQDVQDGIRKHVSVGYRIHAYEKTGEREGEPIYTVTDWEPYEISIVAVPFDPSVGVGRSLEIPQEETCPAPQETENVRNAATNQLPGTKQTMIIKVTRNASGALVRAEVDEQGKIIKELEVLQTADELRSIAAGSSTNVPAHSDADAARGVAAERTRNATLTQMGEQFKRALPNAPELAARAIAEGKSVDQFNADLVKEFGTRASKPLGEQSSGVDIGLTDKEVRQFSFLKAVRAMAPNASKKDREAAAFEFECSEAAQRSYGKEAKGILIPTDVLSRRLDGADLSRSALNAGGVAGNGQTGALLVQTQMLYGSFIDMLRNRTTIMRLATIMGGLVGNVDIPKQTGGAQGYWLGEGQDASETGIALGQISFSPKTVAAFTDITRRLMQQASMDAEAMLRRDLNIALSQAIDLAGYYGAGTDSQPRGIRNYTGINGVDFAAAQAPTFAELVKMETEVAADNADAGQMGYVGHTRFRGHCKTTPKFGSGTESTIWEPGGTVNGYRTEITNQVNADDVFFGNFADFIIAMWGGLDLTVDPYTLSKSGGLRLVVFQDVDMNLRRVESICWGSHNVS